MADEKKWVTNRDDLRATCLVCGSVQRIEALYPWPVCCAMDMLVVNTTDREGKEIKVGSLKLQDADDVA